MSQLVCSVVEDLRAKAHVPVNMQILQLSMLGWTQEMIGNSFNLSQDAISLRFQREIADLQKLVESKLKLKNPADLTSDPEAPTPEILAWALSQRRPNRLFAMSPRTIPAATARANVLSCSVVMEIALL